MTYREDQEDDLTHAIAFWFWESTRISSSPDSLATWWLHQILWGQGWGGCSIHLQILVYSHWAALDTGGEDRHHPKVGTVSLMTDTFFCRWKSLREAILWGGVLGDEVHALFSHLICMESSVVKSSCSSSIVCSFSSVSSLSIRSIRAWWWVHWVHLTLHTIGVSAGYRSH